MFAGSWITLAALMWVITLGRSPFKLPLASWGAVIAHIGMAVTVVGITLVSLYDTEKDVRLEKGQSYTNNCHCHTNMCNYSPPASKW